MTDLRHGIPSAFKQFVQDLDGEYYLAQDVADALRCSYNTVWTTGRKNPELGPSFKTFYGERPLYLYTAEDVEALRAFLKKKWGNTGSQGLPGRRGRPRMWSAEERKARRSQRKQVEYWSQCIVRCEQAGRADLAADYRAKVTQLRARLKADFDERWAEVTRPPHPPEGKANRSS